VEKLVHHGLFARAPTDLVNRSHQKSVSAGCAARLAAVATPTNATALIKAFITPPPDIARSIKGRRYGVNRGPDSISNRRLLPSPAFLAGKQIGRE
jgi:hypothetical protein